MGEDGRFCWGGNGRFPRVNVVEETAVALYALLHIHIHKRRHAPAQR
ncbi:MAG: hypothetical protein H6658_17920 [Ardenticatenaceae bacterium]|nr:hypothetical protein [Ardenticatenaceae bacterium]